MDTTAWRHGGSRRGAALSQTSWPQAILEGADLKPILGHLLNLLPKRPAQVVSMQSAKGVMSTWDEVRRHVYLTDRPASLPWIMSACRCRESAQALSTGQAFQCVCSSARVMQETLAHKARVLTQNPEATMGMVDEVLVSRLRSGAAGWPCARPARVPDALWCNGSIS